MATGYFSRFDNKGIPFMEGAEKGDIIELLGRYIEIAPDYGFINGDSGRFAVFHLADDATRFYFAPSVITNILDEVDRDGKREEFIGTPLQIVKRVSRSGKSYYAIEFDPVPFE